jgi:tetratricopeptide (TPR) repeat protein
VLFKGAYSLDIAMVQNPTLGLNQRVSLGYKFGTGRKGPAKNLEFAAKEHFDNAMAELDKRHYSAAAKSLDMAISLDSRLGDNGWKTKAKRLRVLVKALELPDHPEYEASFAQPTAQANQGYQAVMAYLDHDDGLAMLLGHAALGQDPKEVAYQALLDTMAALTHGFVRHEDILPTDSLVERRLVALAKSLYSRDFDGAIRAGKEAVMLNPNHALAWTRLGSAYFASGNKLEAAAAYRKALDLEPANQQLRAFMKQQGME